MNNIWNELSEESKEYIRKLFNEYEPICEADLIRMNLMSDLFGKENLKPQIKTWDDLEKYDKVRSDLYAPVFSELSACNILPKGLFNKLVATIQIAELINTSYGGIVTNEEWADSSIVKHTIWYDSIDKEFCKNSSCREKTFLSFHTVEQRNEFLENNESLCKDYFMIN